MRQHQFIMALGGRFLLMFCLDTAAQDAGPVQYGTTQEGRYGVGHDKWQRPGLRPQAPGASPNR